MMWFFNFAFVLLGSCLAGSLYEMVPRRIVVDLVSRLS